MYKVDYYTLALIKIGDKYEAGNVMQYKDTYYTEHELKVIPQELQRVINIIKGNDKFKPVITNIQLIEGHGER